MTYEKSCGGIVYRKFHGNTEILLIKHIKSGYWSFPKGHVENGETEEETAKREIKEETGIDVYIDSGFRETVTYSPRKDAKKRRLCILSPVQEIMITPPQLEEISEIRWVGIGQAHNLLVYDNDKLIVNKAKSFIALMK